MLKLKLILASVVLSAIAFYSFTLPNPAPPSDVTLDRLHTDKAVIYKSNKPVIAAGWFVEATQPTLACSWFN